MIKELTAEQIYTPSALTEKDIKRFTGKTLVIGQDRALKAIRFGMEISAKGYNIFCAGPKGVGRTVLTLQEIKKFAVRQKTPDDWCFLNNFDSPYQPIALNFPAGLGRQFAKDIQKMIAGFKLTVPALFLDEAYKIQLAHIEQQVNHARLSYFEAIKKSVETSNVCVVQLENGITLAPMKRGKKLSPERFNALPKEERKTILEDMQSSQKKLETALKEAPNWETVQQIQIEELHTKIASKEIDALMKPLLKNYAKFPVIKTHLEAVRTDLLANIGLFTSLSEEQTPEMIAEQIESLWDRYQVNLLVSHKPDSGAPVLHLNHPTLSNLLGRIERQQKSGSLMTDFSMIRAGALHQANGGYLLIEARELLANPYVWNALKRSLFSKQIKIESGTDDNSVFDIVSLTPAAIPLNIKIILVGEPDLYYALIEQDDEFGELFKIHSRFAEKMDRSLETERLYGQLMTRFAQSEKLKPFSVSALKRVLEYASRLSGDCMHLTTYMTHVQDLMREASYFAKSTKSKDVLPEHIEQALEAKRQRTGFMQDDLLDLVRRGIIGIDTGGFKIGQLNALVVHEYGSFAFGRPNRVTCRVRLGQGNFIDVEREAELGGALHSKGVLILSSYLASRFSAGVPISLDASLVFEQSYSELDGDSASSTELYCLLSAIGDIPLNQALAVTGSVNQLGEVQAVGAVNEKIEGFFSVCQMNGLTGEQGVIIPKSNVQNLMLDPQVVEAVRQKKFHIYAVSTIDEGLSVLSGLPIGEPDEKGKYPANSINGKIRRRLDQFYKQAQKTSLETAPKVSRKTKAVKLEQPNQAQSDE